MEWITDDEFEETVNRVILQPMLVQGWMGYGGVTFFGFGDHVRAPIIRWRRCLRRKSFTRGKRRRKFWHPRCQLQTGMSYWAVIDDDKTVLGHSESSRNAAETILASIVGLCVSRLELHESNEIDIFFTTGLKLATRPYPGHIQPENNLWGVRESNGFYSWVRRDGRTYRNYKHELLYMKQWNPEWFLPPAVEADTLAQ